MAKWELKLWEVTAGNRYRGFVVAKTEVAASKLAKEKIPPHMHGILKLAEIPIDGYKLVERGESADDRTGEAGGS
jgi:hypothetical protein